MNLVRAILFLVGLLFVWVGLFFLFDPVAGAQFVTIELSDPLGVADFRAVYGGLDLAVGCLILMAVLRNEIQFGLRIQALAFGGLLTGRLVGQWLDAPADGYALLLIAIDLFGLVLAFVGMRVALRRPKPVGQGA